MCLFHKTEDAQLEFFRKAKQISCQKGSYETDMRFPTMWYVQPTKAQTNLGIRGV